MIKACRAENETLHTQNEKVNQQAQLAQQEAVYLRAQLDLERGIISRQVKEIADLRLRVAQSEKTRQEAVQQAEQLAAQLAENETSIAQMGRDLADVRERWEKVREVIGV